MPLPILSPRRLVEATTYCLVYDSLDHPGSGYGFDCDADGTIHPLTPSQQQSYDWVQAHLSQFRAPVVQPSYSRYWEPAIARCYCGAEVALPDPLDNQCRPCGRWYNGLGQAVIPSHLCDETGEPYPEPEL